MKKNFEKDEFSRESGTNVGYQEGIPDSASTGQRQ